MRGASLPARVVLRRLLDTLPRPARGGPGGAAECRHDRQLRLTAERGRPFRTDSLTGVDDRVALRHAVVRALARTRVPGRAAGALLLDVDGFTSVNDSHGQHGGDELLRQVAARLLALCRSGEVVARLGGDEFIVLAGSARLSDCVELSERIVAALRAPYDLGGSSVVVSASVGVVYADDEQDHDAFLQQADVAMRVAKAAGGDRVVVFDAATHTVLLDRQALGRDLRTALGQGQLSLVYQPIIDLRTGATCGAEALMRWTHPTRGAVCPTVFVPMAESAGLIGRLGAWVLEQACLQLAAWDALDTGGQGLHMAINVSRRQLDGELADTLRRITSRTGIAPGRLLLEITETAFVEGDVDLAQQLEDLRAVGCRIAVDDFGTGYSALNELRRIPVQVLKIDKSFVDGIASSREELAVTTAIVRLAQSLHKTTVAEGVETGAQLAHLLGLGCELAQGFLFSRPLDPDAFTAYRSATPVYQPLASAGFRGLTDWSVAGLS
ncbi:MAG: bifunctional diguanylate cyclase/phosphodiesterase [Mycobacteriales bacterium]|nr:bifunctional diguanylate cyclase/phosphodiesterase [Mycobacteriales bacterium]